MNTVEGTRSLDEIKTLSTKLGLAEAQARGSQLDKRRSFTAHHRSTTSSNVL
jgi:hypothetical protein